MAVPDSVKCSATGQLAIKKASCYLMHSKKNSFQKSKNHYLYYINVLVYLSVRLTDTQ